MSKASTEKEIKVLNGHLLYDVSELSLEDEFMKYIPCTERERKLKKSLTKAIEGGAEKFGSKDEFNYIVHIGNVIKELSNNNCSVAEAWDMVCNDSTSLAGYAHVLKNVPTAQIYFDLASGCYDHLNPHNSVGWIVFD